MIGHLVNHLLSMFSVVGVNVDIRRFNGAALDWYAELWHLVTLGLNV